LSHSRKFPYKLQKPQLIAAASAKKKRGKMKKKKQSILKTVPFGNW